MPGFVAIAGNEAPEGHADTVQEMAFLLPRRVDDHADSAFTPGFGICAVWRGGDHRLVRNDRHVLCLDGNVYATDAGPAPTAQTLLNAVTEQGLGALQGLNGVYCVLVWDLAERALHVVTDRGGFRKAYLAEVEGGLAVVTRYECLLRHPRFRARIRPQGLVEFLEYNHLLDDGTLLEGVDLAPRGSVTTWRGGRLQSHRYWDYAFAGDAGTSPGEGALLEEFHVRLTNAVARRARENTCVFVTGGLDSRALAGTLHGCTGSQRVMTQTVGERHAQDVRFGARIARALGWPHTVIPPTAERFEWAAPELVSRTEGGMNCINSYGMFGEADLLRHGIETVMLGFLGDRMTGSHLHAPEPGTKEEAFHALENRFFRGVFGTGLCQVLRPEIHEPVHGHNERTLRQRFDEAPEPAGQPMRKFEYVGLTQRQRRFVACHIEMYEPVFTVLNPFTDTELIDFLLRLPTALRLDQRLYKAYLCAFMPRVARVPRTGSQLPVQPHWLRDRAIRARMAFVHKALPRATGGLFVPRSTVAAVNFARLMRGGGRQLVNEMLLNRDLFGDVMQLDEVERIRRAFMEGDDAFMPRAATLLSFALWRRRYQAAAPA